MNRKIAKSLSALTLIGMMMGMDVSTAHAQTGNEIELRGVRSRVAILVVTPVLVAAAVPNYQDFKVLVDEENLMGDGSIYSEAQLEVTDMNGNTTDMHVEATLADGPNGLEVTSDVRVGRAVLTVELVLPPEAGVMVNVFTGFLGKSEPIRVFAGDGQQELGRLILAREDRDGSGLDDSFKVEYTNGQTQAVYEKYYDWSLYQNEVHAK